MSTWNAAWIESEDRVVYMMGVRIPDRHVVQSRNRSVRSPDFDEHHECTGQNTQHKHVTGEALQLTHVNRMAHADRENAACSRLSDSGVR